MKAATYTIYERTNEAGLKVYAGTFQAQPIMAETTDREKAESYIRSKFDKATGKAILRHWNGDTGEDTFLADNHQ